MTASVNLVLGGTGKTGRRVVSRLRELGLPVRPLSRSTEIPFDWADRGTWGPAVEGGGALYLVPPPDVDSAHEFVQLAVAAGVRRIVVLSARGADLYHFDAIVSAERAARESGVEWTILQPNHFFQNFSEDVLRDPVLAGEVVLPTGDHPDPMVDAEDIAEVAVTALTQEGHAGRTHVLTGPRGISFAEATAIVAEQSGRAISYKEVSGPEYVDHLVAQGFPADAAEVLRIVFEAVREGTITGATGDVERVLGRPPRDFESYVRRSLDSWA
ncbi:NAD(P)H-binding protein [Allokutzneria sp. NRRL B-24872]|uniref:NmrA family NAD(P)-binding protein n=1 Tax=Allokutzneria sp. NRRL B-24872 TaxID=1137961 RepID=UPI000A366DFB|nr:NAD(P)H-binding protein [Allokutzneria sp. NRRL B-24872]